MAIISVAIATTPTLDVDPAGAVAVRFFECIRARDVEGFGRVFDEEGWARRAFGEAELARHTAAELRECYEAVERYQGHAFIHGVTMPYTMGEIGKPRVRRRDGGAAAGGASAAVVELEIKRVAGDSETWEVTVRRGADGNWGVADVATKGHAFSRGIGETFERRRGEVPGLTAVRWMKDMAEHVERVQKERTAKRAAATRAASAASPAPHASPEDTVDAYFDLLRQQRVTDAIVSCWDLQVLFRLGFEDSNELPERSRPRGDG